MAANANGIQDEMLRKAMEFLEQCYDANDSTAMTAFHKRRLDKVTEAIGQCGIYELTARELSYGAKMAWRNAPSCIGRIEWSKLKVFDARTIESPLGIFKAITNHIKYGTNKGNIRSAVTIFPSAIGGQDFRIWNTQLIQYAGYNQDGGSVVGDPSNVDFTKVCRKLGWTGSNGPFDVLPLVISIGGREPEFFRYPKDLILEVEITHPKYEWFGELGLRWYVMATVSNMSLECGGLTFPVAPFNRCYMVTEIAIKKLCSADSYNILEEVGVRLGLDTMASMSLWRDKAVLEVTEAVLHSFMKAGVNIVEHHHAAESFLGHLNIERDSGMKCPVDWAGIVRPISGILSQILAQHRPEKLTVSPSYTLQEPPWERYVWKVKRRNSQGVLFRKLKLKNVSRAIRLSGYLMLKALANRVQCTILYASESGTSENYAMELGEIFKGAFNTKVLSMDKYDVTELEHETLVLIVTSVFGNGDPPRPAQEFTTFLDSRRNRVRNQADGRRRLSITQNMAGSFEIIGYLNSIKYAVFGLGSRVYPKFCAFARYVDALMGDLGAGRLLPLAEGDELCGQYDSFKTWSTNIYKVSCDFFCAGNEHDNKAMKTLLRRKSSSWLAEKYKILVCEESKTNLVARLSHLHKKNVLRCNFKSRIILSNSSHKTIRVVLDTCNNGASEMSYNPGDHVAIYPRNNPKMVSGLFELISITIDDVDQHFTLLNREDNDSEDLKWVKSDRLPECSLREAFTCFLDITSAPLPALLKEMSTLATSDPEKSQLHELANSADKYDDWKFITGPTLIDTLRQFPSVRVPVTLLLMRLPLLKHRLYSISSSPAAYPDQIHLTVSVIQYSTKAGVTQYGVCSNWLDGLSYGAPVPCHVRPTPSFHLPTNQKEPVIMVGPGTGIAPFRSFWQQRQADVSQAKTLEIDSFGQLHLYFGCRTSKNDDIYGEETQAAKEEGVLTEVYTALSREPSMKKVYVQDMIKRNSCEIFDLLVRKGGHLFVCGDVSMATNIHNAIQQVFETEGDLTSDDAEERVRDLKRDNRYHEDIFGVTLRTSEVTELKRKLSRAKMKLKVLL